MLNALSSTVRFLRRATAACLVLGSVVACDDPPIDDATPTPKGVIEGSMLYIGPRPQCTYVDGVATQVMGRLLLTIADNTKLLPPEGTASQPVDFLAVGGEDIFALEDCRPENFVDADLAQVIMKTATFRWTDLPLAVGLGATVKYRISGFYDQEGDFNPLFAVAQSPTRGDMAGAALENAQVANPQFKLVEFGSAEENPLGIRVTGIALTMGGFVQTEPPIFRVTSGAIRGDAPVTDGTQTITLSLFSRLPNDAARVELDTLMGHVGMAGFVNFADPVQYAWYVERFDLNRDGVANENHPVAMGLPYKSPYIFLQRYQNPIEVATGIPNVALIPIVADPRHAVYPDMTAGLSMFAAMVVNPANPLCNAAVAREGGFPQFFADPSTAKECHDLPTGYYGVNALNGIASGTAGPQANPAISNTMADIVGGQFASQVWRIPNELGDCRQLNGGPNCNVPGAEIPEGAFTPVASQGVTGAALVYDSTPTGANGRREPGGEAACGAMTYADFPGGNAVCCAPVLHLCDIPLCPYVDATPTWSGGTTYQVRGTPTSIVRGSDGVNRPNCMPFPIPTQCCPNEVPAAPAP